VQPVIRLPFAVLAVVIVGAAVAPPALAQSATGFVCVAPRPKQPPTTSSPDIPPCPSNNLAIKVDDKEAVEWSRTESLALSPLDPTRRHRVTIQCDGKPQQSFTFRFSEYQSSKLCLFLNDFYQTVQLWERERAPWCKCK
jgi:hypothetical protein